MATILLTQQETLLSFELDESQIEMVRADAGGSYVERSDPHNTGYNGNPLFVTQTPEQIASQSENLIPLVISKTGDQWTSVFLNGSVNHFGSIQADTTSVLGNSRFEYFRNGNTMEIYLAQETTAIIGALLQQIENGSKNPVFTTVTLPGGGYTLTAADMKSGFVKVNATGAGILTLDSASNLAAELGAASGTTFKLVLLNIGAANGQLALPASITNSVINPADLAAGRIVANEAYVYEFVFVDGNNANIGQII